MHMAALALTFGLLVFWLALGWAVQVVIRPQLASLPNLLLSPLIGFTVTLIPVFWFSVVGLPVRSFALPLTIVLALAAIAGWAFRRPDWTRTDLLAVGVVALAVLGSGLPTLVFGFDWVANANDDWANYNLGAIRLIEHGMLHQPDIAAMAAGRDYPGFLYFLTVAHDTRPGSELMLAWLGALTRQSPFFVFMPLILAFEAMMLCSAAALALLGARTRQHWFLGLVLTALAPLSLYAVQQQLIAQFLGIAFTCGMAALTCTRLADVVGWRRLALVVLTTAGYIICYPEMSPFYGLAFLVFHLAHARDRSWGWQHSWRLLVIPGGLAIITGPYLVAAVYFLLSQFTSSATQGSVGGVSIFPYFLVPSGAAMLWGLVPFGTFPSEPWLSISIVAALVLVGLALLAAILRLGAGSVVGGMLLLFALVAVQLAWKRNDFGLFKIAMFVQPFLWFTLMGAVPRRRNLPLLVAAGIGIVVISTDVRMTTDAFRDDAGGGTGLPGASRTHLLHRILDDSDSRWCDVDFETSNLPLLKIIAARIGCTRLFSSRYSGVLTVSVDDGFAGDDPLHRIFGIDDFVRSAGRVLSVAPKLTPVEFRRPDGSALEGRFFNLGRSDLPRIGVTQRAENILNEHSSEFPTVQAKNIVAERLEFIESSFGDSYYIPNFPIVGMYATEHDPFAISSQVQAVGRYMLFRVEESSPEIRLSIDISTTLISSGSRQLPPAMVLGETSASFNLVGNGSARVMSPPVKPLIVGGNAYVLLDLGRDATQMQSPRTGAMLLYGSKYSVDYRVVTAFARRIAAFDAAHCDCEAAPAAITDMKTSLIDPTQQYSGIYEDGWIGQDGFARLAGDRAGIAELKFMFPNGIGVAHNQVTLTVEGGRTVTRPLDPGSFSVSVPIESGPHKIAWHFADAGRLPGGDDRSVSAKLESLTVLPDTADEANTWHATPLSSEAALGNAPLPRSGVESDGWVGKDGFVSVDADVPGRAALTILVPGGIGIADDEVTLTIDGGPGVTRHLEPGEATIDLPVVAGSHRISWHFAKVGVLPNGDGRTVAALLRSVSLVRETSGARGTPISQSSP